MRSSTCFGWESMCRILIHLVDSVLKPPPEHRLSFVELLNPFNPKEAFDDKLSILDIKVRDESGRQFNVEMQMLLNSYFPSRIVYYLAKFHQQQLHQGEDYSVLKPTIAIIFTNEILFPQVPDYHLKFRLLEEQHRFPFAIDLEIHTLELPKFKKRVAELADDLDKWLYFLTNAEKIDLEALPENLNHPLIRQALEELRMLMQSDIERERYEARRKAQLDFNSGMKAAHLKGLAEGEKAVTIRSIHFCEKLLLRSETPLEQLQQMSSEELTRLAEDLQTKVLSLR